MKRENRRHDALAKCSCLFRHAALTVLPAAASLVSALNAAPVIVHQPFDLSVGLGDRAGFVVDATAAQPVSFQWYHDSVLVPGGTSDLLLIEQARSADAGSYRVKITDETGETWSSAASLTVAPYTTTYVDPSFRTQDNQNTITASVLLADGRLVLAQGTPTNPALLRLNADGSRDPTFRAPTLDAISVIVAANDGSLYLGLGNPARPYLAAKLAPTGGLDSTFQITQATGAIVVIPQGSKVVVDRPTGLVRLNADGSVDSSFVFAAPTEAVGQSIVAGCAGAQGKIYVATADVVWRITADGESDPSFAPYKLANLIGSAAVPVWPPDVPHPAHVRQLAALPSGGVMVETERATGSDWPPYSVATVQRLTDSGALDPTFNHVEFWDGSPHIAVLPDGRLLLSGATAAAYTHAWSTGLALMNADGTLDAKFQPVDLPRNNDGANSRGSFPFVHVLPGGTQAIVGGKSADTWRRINLRSVGAPPPPRILRVTPASAALTAGDDLTLTVQVVGPGPLTLGGSYWQGTPGSSTVTFQNPYPNNSTVMVYAYGLGGTDAREVPITFAPAAPHFTTTTETIVTSVGRDVRLQAERRGTPSISLEWSHDQTVLVPADSYPLSGYDYLDLHHVSLADAGDYRVVARNPLGQAVKTIHLVVLPTSSIVNVSCRARIESGDRAAILGLTLDGASSQRVLARAIGTELSIFGIAGWIAQPGLRVRRGSAAVPLEVASPNDLNSVGAFWRLPVLSTSVEAAATLPPDTYTLTVSPQDDVPGIGLVEFFQLDRNATQITAFSARTFVGVGEKVALTGFTVDGGEPIRLLVRAVGPGLRTFGVGEPLADPVLQVVKVVDRAMVGENDDWESGANAAAVAAATNAVQAFPLGSAAKDAALVVSVPPGMYTVVVSGKNAQEGIALTQVYVLP